jgi:ribosomal-protein-alanine N-acetyltransferase
MQEHWLTTPRLALRRFTRDDLDWLADFYADYDVAHFLGGTKTRQETEELLDTRILNYYEEHPGLGIWQTVERDTGAPIGFHLLNHIRGESIIQVGYGLLTPAWGKGYATEMAEAVVRYGFADLGLPTIAGMAHIDNVASQKVLLKIGLHRNGERAFPHPAYASLGAMAWFERDRTGWFANDAR